MMKYPLVWALILAPGLYAADRSTDKMLELQRDLSTLQDQLKAWQKSQEERLAAWGQKQAEQIAAATAQTGKALAELGDRWQKGQQDLIDQQTRDLGAMAALTSNVQSLSGELKGMRESVAELTVTMGRLTTQVSDLTASVKALQAAKLEPAAAAPELSATDLWTAAEGDQHGGKLDLALREYSEYVARFGTTAQAPDAQYYIGSIHYSNEEWEEAIKAFDAVLQGYPDSKRIPEALYYKGYSLGKLGRWPEAAAALKDLRKRFPDHSLARQSLTIKPPTRQ